MILVVVFPGLFYVESVRIRFANSKTLNLSYLHCIIFHSYRNVFRVYSENMDSLKNFIFTYFFSSSLVLISRIRNRKKNNI